MAVSGQLTRNDGAGILPIAKSNFIQDRELVDWGVDWNLGGHGLAYSDCGEWRTTACLNVDEYNQQGILEKTVGKVYIYRYRRTCLRAECPTCYESWAGKEAGKIEYRLKAWSKGRVIHVVISPPSRDWLSMDYKALRSKFYKIALSRGFIGGSAIFHPFRRRCFLCGGIVKEGYESCICGSVAFGWVFSPHFHVLGYGWIKHTKELYEKDGWVVKNIGVRKTVSGTALYQLSHAGVHKHYHTITWFWRLSYRNLKVPKMERKKHVCPICGNKLKPVYYFSRNELPEEKGFYWLDPGGFRY